MLSSAIFKFIAVSLATQVTAFPVNIKVEERAQSVIIGYRTVSAEQGARYNKAGTLTNDGNRIGTQIGAGVYTTPVAGGWPDSAALDKVNKARIPQSHASKKLWFAGDKAIDAYIKAVIPKGDPKKTIRISTIDGTAGEQQMVVPPGLLNSNKGGLGITASCKKTLAELPSTVVNFSTWSKVFRSA
ncbi:predicted protein [Verticillium alfalfae VaMs.102]|uniref:Predicted protein n=1 Tax=Verticillium alfalfae (strain VaMs.102 / ATCC MYA-4576 / FGSC 10136) TaxID=526221 RepID=C9SND8_VERA1|nr:predicted protein [Verticillium alfalfae VaMs.102]EEY20303.1 predicted protein [Verticillium alfalfae VaMs.102]